MKTYFIIIPELVLTGPTKGSIAIANGLSFQKKKVFLISLKENNLHLKDLNIKRGITIISLNGNLISKIKKFKILCKNYNPNFRISIGFSADFINLFTCSFGSLKISSVRGNLFVNYELDFGFRGKLLAFLHYFIISKFKIVFSMTKSMQSFLNKRNIKSVLIGNFVDEQSLKLKRKKRRKFNTIKFLFLGSLTVRKNIIFMMEGFMKFSKNKNDVELLIIGDGPQKKLINERAKLSGGKIKFLGFKTNPYSDLNKSNVIVLLSKSEGMSRAVLEALFFGNIALLSDVDGNREIIENGKNGFLFNENKNDLLHIFEKCYLMCKNNDFLNENLIPHSFSQESQVKKIIMNLESKNNSYYNYLKSRSFSGKIYRNFFLYPKINKYLTGKILDIGCGIGDFLKYNNNACGVDINPNTVDHCISNGLNARLFLDNKIPYENNSFDSIIMDNVMEHIESPISLLKESKRLLKKRGLLLIGVPGSNGYKHDPDHKIFYDASSLISLLKSNGFKHKSTFYTPFKSEFLNNKMRQYCLYVQFEKI